jgi:PKD repeat protein
MLAPMLGGLLALLLAAAGPAAAQSGGGGQWQSDLVYYDENGDLTYEQTENGNRIPDFSWAGYKNGETPIPEVPTVRTIGPASGDDTERIQQAIDEVGAMPKDEDGIRGALLLEAGAYQIGGVIRQTYDGVVLRGAGDGSDPSSNTIIEGTGNTPAERTVVVIGRRGEAPDGARGEGWDPVAGTRTDITSDFVRVGSRSFTVADASGYDVGDNIILFHPASEGWLEAVNYGETAGDRPWQVGGENIIYNRYIKAIDGDEITVGAPVYNDLDRSVSQSFIYRHDRDGIATQVGVEDLRVDIQSDGRRDEDHARNAVRLIGVEDAWVRGATTTGFVHAGFQTAVATRVTVEEARAIDPVSRITGGRRYNFNATRASNQILFQNTLATEARHAYVSNATSTASGIVFHDVESRRAYSPSEGHRRWVQGMLYDNLRERNRNANFVLGLYNHGSYGTGHGWGNAHSVVWNSNVAGGKIAVEKPPTAQNYVIGSFGNVGNGPFNKTLGYVEGMNREGLYPASLYEAQLADRLAGGGNRAPLASFTASPTAGEPPLEVRFDASDATDPDGRISSYAWDFGDGATADGPTPTHTYDQPGVYDAALTVTDDGGRTTTASQQIRVRRPGTLRALEPTDDTYVRGGTGDQTSGDSESLVTKTTDSRYPNFVCYTYYKFDLSSLPDGATVSDVTLSVYHPADDDEDAGVTPTDGVFGLDDVSWQEETASFDAPPGGSFEATGTAMLDDTTYTDGVAGRLAFDVTSYVQSQRAAGADSVTFKQEQVGNTSQYGSFASKESADDRAPQLVIEGQNLPVEFAGAPSPTVDGRRVVLTWRTLAETNNAGFRVQHKGEAASGGWTSASGLVPTKAEGGTTDREIRYRHELTGLAPGRYRFRIQQHDRDGDRSAGPATKRIEVAGGEEFALKAAYPNPLRGAGDGAATLEARGVSDAEDVRATLYNSLGQQVRALTVAEDGAIKVEPQGLSSGVYFVRLTAGDRTASQSITLVR